MLCITWRMRPLRSTIDSSLNDFALVYLAVYFLKLCSPSQTLSSPETDMALRFSLSLAGRRCFFLHHTINSEVVFQ